MKISSDEYLAEVARGNVDGAYIVDKFGSNDNVGTTFEPVASSGLYQMTTTLTSLEVLSNNANDTALGTGAREVTIEGIGTDWQVVREVVTLNGTTPVATVNQYYRVYKCYVCASGSYASVAAPSSHAGTIDVRTVGAGAVWGEINVFNSFSLSSSEIGMFTVPKGHTGYILDEHIHIESGKKCHTVLFKREGADIVVAPFSAMIAMDLERFLEKKFTFTKRGFGEALVGPCDVGFMAAADTGTTSISVEFQILIVRDS